MELQENIPSLDTTQTSPVYELHATIDVVGKPHTNCESHCNRWDAFGQRCCLNNTFQPINHLVPDVGWNRKKHAWIPVEYKNILNLLLLLNEKQLILIMNFSKSIHVTHTKLTTEYKRNQRNHKLLGCRWQILSRKYIGGFILLAY